MFRQYVFLFEACNYIVNIQYFNMFVVSFMNLDIYTLLKPFFDSVFCLFQTCNIHNAKNVTSITAVFEIFSLTGKTRISLMRFMCTSNPSLQNDIRYVSLWKSNSQSFHHVFTESEKLVHFRNINNAGYFLTFLKIQRVKTLHIAG